MRQYKKDKMTYKQLVSLSLAAVMGILVIAFAAYSYLDFRRESQESALREAQSTSRRVVAQVDDRLNTLKRYFSTEVEEEDIRWILENNIKYSDYSRYSAAYEAMACKSFFNGYVAGFTLVNFDTGWVLNNKGLFPLEETVNGEILDELFEEREGRAGKNYWVYDDALGIENTIDRKYRLTIETEGLNLVFRLPYFYNAYAMMIINVNMDTWKQWMQDMIGTGQEIVVLDTDGLVIYSTNPSLGQSCANLLTDSGEAPAWSEGRGAQYMAAYSTSDVLGWRYYVLHDVDLERSGLSFAWTWVLLLAVLAVICFALVVYVIYQPIRNLVKEVAEEETLAAPVKNELEFLKGNFRTLKEDRQTLRERVRQNQGKLQEMFELRLLRGEIRREEEYQEYVEELGLQPWKYFATAVVILNLKEEENQSNINEDMICLQLVEEMPEELKRLAWMPPVYNSCTIFAIFGEDDEDILLESIASYYRGMQVFAEAACNCRILMGVSANHTDHRHIRAAYWESINAMTSHILEQKEPEIIGEMADCHFYVSSTTLAGSDYDASFEKEIQLGIQSMDKIRCYNATDDFTACLAGLNAKQEEMTVYLLRFVNAVFSMALEAKVDLARLYPNGLHQVYNELLEVLEPSRERRYIKRNLIDPILSARNELLENRSYSMMEDIERMIAQYKGNITLTECADSLGVHPTYIWKVLKTEKGKTFSDYLEEYKLNEAKRLLLQTGMTVAEIAAELNYTNAQNFIRFFSKSTGITPGKCRKLYS